MQSPGSEGRGRICSQPISISSAISKQEAGIFIAMAVGGRACSVEMEEACGDRTRGYDAMSSLVRFITADRHKRSHMILRPCPRFTLLDQFLPLLAENGRPCTRASSRSRGRHRDPVPPGSSQTTFSSLSSRHEIGDFIRPPRSRGEYVPRPL